MYFRSPEVRNVHSLNVRKHLLTGMGMEMVSVGFQFQMMPWDLYVLLTGVLFCVVTDLVNGVSLNASLDTQTVKNWAMCYGFQW